jgi:hypothetical protein
MVMLLLASLALLIVAFALLMAATVDHSGRRGLARNPRSTILPRSHFGIKIPCLVALKRGDV